MLGGEALNQIQRPRSSKGLRFLSRNGVGAKGMTGGLSGRSGAVSALVKRGARIVEVMGDGD